MIERFQNILISIIISITLIGFYDYYKERKASKSDELFVFSAKNIIEHKKLQIKKALLNNEDIQNKEKELENLIIGIEQLLEELTIIYNKPIFQKEMILKGNTKDITPLIEKSLASRGLL